MVATSATAGIFSPPPFLLRRRRAPSKIICASVVSAETNPPLATTPSRPTASPSSESPLTDGKVIQRSTLKDYFAESTTLVRETEGGPPRWLVPLDCGPSSKDAPVLLYLPGLTGNGLGLTLHHHRLGKVFDMWCLHIPFTDRKSFMGLITLVEDVVKIEHSRAPNKPIYIVGESFGGCLALAVAARNPSIDLMLILSNPATSYGAYPFQTEALLPATLMIPSKLPSSLFFIISLLSGVPLKMVGEKIGKLLPLEQIIGDISQDTEALSAYLSALSDFVSIETLVWKLELLKTGATYANSRLSSVKAQTLILASGRDQLLPSKQEAERLRKIIGKCEVRVFDESNHALFLDPDIDLVPTLSGASFYRRGLRHNYVSDYLPPSPDEFQKIYNPQRWIETITDPVMISTLDNGKLVRNLDGIHSQGPVLYVGYHMMLGFEVVPLVARFWEERDIILRGIAHPMMYVQEKEGQFPPLSSYDIIRKMGAVPVSASNFYRLMSSRSHVLLYPGGVREALHRKEYKLFWPEQSEFVRMAARFGAKIIPFGCVGEDDVGELLLDYNDLTKLPYFKQAIQEITQEAVKLRTEAKGDVSNQDLYLPILLPKLPGRFYYYFGKPIETQGREEELKSKEMADEVYMQVKTEVEKCLNFLKEKRNEDPYRNIFARIAYRGIHGSRSQVPTFDF